MIFDEKSDKQWERRIKNKLSLTWVESLGLLWKGDSNYKYFLREPEFP